MAKRRKRGSTRKWYLVDLHLHTPASADYQEADVTYLDILRAAAARGLEIIAFTDHNTVAGLRRLQEELEQLEMLESLGRLQADEGTRLEEFRNLLKKILVLPGFEFTATFGFHILGIFPPEKPVRELEHLLLSLNVPPSELDTGSVTVGASADVLTAYRAINQAGGLAIAAHANSSNGVAMRGFPFGGQTKIAYTQDPNLHALEVTDLEQKGRRTTAGFFSGTKPEYPRRMHCIQGSDAHRLRADPNSPKNLGIGDRATEMLLREVSFDSLLELFQSHDFARTRARRAREDQVYDFVQQAREDGASIVQDFHASMTVRGGRLYAIIADICAMANANGGTLYVGTSANPKESPSGVPNATASRRKLEREISNRISPPLDCPVDVQESQGKTILRVLIPHGDDPPYAVDDNKIYVRDESETGLAVRDEIVTLVRRSSRSEPPEPTGDGELALSEAAAATSEPSPALKPPQTGVEIVEVEDREGVRYYTMHDLRNGNRVKNVTKSSARRLWHYAISQHQSLPADPAKLQANWRGEIGVLRKRGRGKTARYDLAQKTNGAVRIYFGVTEDGIHGQWKSLIGADPE